MSTECVLYYLARWCGASCDMRIGERGKRFGCRDEAVAAALRDARRACAAWNSRYGTRRFRAISDEYGVVIYYGTRPVARISPHSHSPSSLRLVVSDGGMRRVLLMLEGGAIWDRYLRNALI